MKMHITGQECEELRPGAQLAAAPNIAPGPTNRIGYAGGAIHNNGGMVRVAMTATRIRIGCTEISVEAARCIMAHHESRFGGHEHWAEIQ